METENKAVFTPDDISAIAGQIIDGAAVDSWAVQTAGGDSIRDGAREYFAHLPGKPWRVARVTAYRQPCGRWRIGDVDIFAVQADITAQLTEIGRAEIVSAVSHETSVVRRCFQA